MTHTHTHTPWFQVRLFCCGFKYFSVLTEALMSARVHIMIAGWNLVPELALRREKGAEQFARLDLILQRKAMSGVRVYVIVSEHPTSIGNQRAANYLESLHENIKVVLHSPFNIITATLKAGAMTQHQKYVVVDNSLAFLGGIDVTVQRFDHCCHPDTKQRFPLTDPEGNLHPGADFANTRVGAGPVYKKPFLLNEAMKAGACGR